MTTLLIVLILVACAVLAFFILIQKPKGGGLSGSFGSLGTQVMGVKQSTDIMEKGTWYTMAIIAVLSILVIFTYDIQKPATQSRETAPQENAAKQEGSAPATPATPAQPAAPTQ